MSKKKEGLYELRLTDAGLLPILVMSPEEAANAGIEASEDDGIFSFSNVKKILADYHKRISEAWSDLKEEDYLRGIEDYETIDLEEYKNAFQETILTQIHN